MTWFKVDDAFYDHPKVTQLDLEAVGLWTLAGAWSSRHLTDGAVPRRMVGRLGGTDPAAAQLVASGLWAETADGYEFRDWSDYQPSRERVLGERSAKQSAAAAANHKRWHVGRSRVDPDCDLCASTDPDAIADVSQERSQDESQSRSLIYPPNPNPNLSTPNGVDNKPRSRGSRLPPAFAITDDMRAWAAEHVPGLDLDAVLPEFIDYWSAQPGQKGVKTDWVATWRNGMRKQAEWRSRSQQRRLTAAERNAAEYAALYGGGGDERAGRFQAADARELAG